MKAATGFRTEGRSPCMSGAQGVVKDFDNDLAHSMFRLPESGHSQDCSLSNEDFNARLLLCSNT
jgi:hypothetical protein